MGVVNKMPNPVLLPPALYDAAAREGFNLAGFEKLQPIPSSAEMSTQKFAERNPIASMNRHQRRARMRETGYSWAQARALAKRQDREAVAEASFVARAAKLSPEEARQALAEWAARGGK